MLSVHDRLTTKQFFEKGTKELLFQNYKSSPVRISSPRIGRSAFPPELQGLVVPNPLIYRQCHPHQILKLGPPFLSSGSKSVIDNRITFPVIHQKNASAHSEHMRPQFISS